MLILVTIWVSMENMLNKRSYTKKVTHFVILFLMKSVEQGYKWQISDCQALREERRKQIALSSW